MRILILFWTFLWIYQTASLDTLKKSLYFPGSKLIFSYTDERLLYAHYPKDHPDDQVECTVVGEKYSYDNESYVCNVKLKAEKAGNILGNVIKLKSFGKDKAIILWSESEPRGNAAKYVKLSITKLSSCKTVETKVAINNTHGDPTLGMSVVVYDDRIDVFFDNSEYCGETKICRMRVGADGQVISKVSVVFEKPEVKLRSTDLLVPIDTMEPEKGLFYLKFRNCTLLYSIIKSDGNETTFARYKADTSFAGISTAYKTIGVCYTISCSNVKCTQHDVTGKLLFEKTLNALNVFNEIRRIEAVHNSVTGGLLFLARQCEGPNCNNIVVKIDSNGRNIGSLEVGKYGCGSSWGYEQKGILYENENNEVCASFACYGTVGRNGLRHEGRLKLLAKFFFLDNDFHHWPLIISKINAK